MRLPLSGSLFYEKLSIFFSSLFFHYYKTNKKLKYKKASYKIQALEYNNFFYFSLFTFHLNMYLCKKFLY